MGEVLLDEAKLSQELANKLWKIACDLRGNMDSSKFKNYILGIIFYRYLSEHTEEYVESLLKNDGLTYEEALRDPDFAETVNEWQINNLGYIIKPEYLFKTIVQDIKDRKLDIGEKENNTDENKDPKETLVQHFEKAINAITESTLGQDSETAFDKLFDDMNLNDKDLGKEVSDRSKLLSKVILNIDDISFNFKDTNVDILGTAYMILISLFASDAGKKGGEFFTPTMASVLCARLITSDIKDGKIYQMYDPTAGSGSLILQVKNQLGKDNIGHIYAQEYNGSTYNLLRMNLIMHGIDYKKFSTYNGDTIMDDGFEHEKFHLISANPPYSNKYDAPAKLLDDPRFSAAGVLAPKSHEDMAFLEHMVYHMADGGRLACLLPHGVLFRGNTEETIRKYLIDNLNVIDAIIGLPANLFHGASIPVCVVVCRKESNDPATMRNGNSDNILFIDASKYFTKGKNQNFLTDTDIDRIVDAYKERKDIEKFAHVATMQEIKDNGYNLNIPRYVDTAEEEPEISIPDVYASLKKDNSDITEATKQLNKMFAELGLEELA